MQCPKPCQVPAQTCYKSRIEAAAPGSKPFLRGYLGTQPRHAACILSFVGWSISWPALKGASFDAYRRSWLSGWAPAPYMRAASATGSFSSAFCYENCGLRLQRTIVGSNDGTNPGVLSAPW